MENEKIFVRSVPSLLHRAVVHHAMKLYNAFSISTLVEAFKRIQEGVSASHEDYKGLPRYDRVQRRLLLIPPFLRVIVLEAIHGLNRGMELFDDEHPYILQEARRESEEGFCIACMYCLEDSVQAFRPKLEKSVDDDNIYGGYWWLTSPWFRWLMDGSPVPWKQTLRNNMVVALPAIRIGAFFDSLQTEERDVFIHQLEYAESDDVRLCMYFTTKEEEIKLLKCCSMKVLVCCLRWPMRSLFHEKAGEILKHVHSKGYCEFLGYLLSRSINKKVFDFDYFFKCLWENSPSHLKEKAKESPSLREKIELCLTQIKLRRKAEYGDLGNCSKRFDS